MENNLNTRKSQKSENVIKNYSIDITPDKSLYHKMGESGHNFYEVNAEFMDNSIDAMTPEQKSGKEQLRIDITINAKKKFYSIRDNGTGMNEEIATLAAALGKSNKTSDNLGSFGFGLKSGAMTIGDNFIVTTGMKGNDYSTEFTYNHEEWIKQKGWNLPAKNIAKEINEHGTIVTIPKVTKVQLTPQRTQYLKADIAKRYSSFIRKGNVRIAVNNVIVTVEDVKWAEGYPIDFNIPTKYGTVKGKIGLMVESSQKGYYGFDMFRNGRMIVTNSKFAISSHPTNARITGEIHLDFVKVSHEKNKFITDSIEYEIAEQACRNSEAFKSVVREAKKKNEEGDNKKENITLDKEIEADIPIIGHMIKQLGYDIGMHSGKGNAIQKSKTGLLKGLFQRLETKKRKEYEKREEPKSDYAKKSQTGGENHGNVIQVNGLTFKVNREYHIDKNAGRKSYGFDDKQNILTVYINKAYAGFKTTKDKVTYTRETVIDAIVSFLYKDHVIILEKYNETKDDLVSGILSYREEIKEDALVVDDDIMI